MKMEGPNVFNSVPERPKLTMSTTWPRERHHTAPARPVEPHYRTQVQDPDLSPRTTSPPRSDTFNHEGLDIDPAAQVQFNPRAPYQQPQMHPDPEGTDSNPNVLSSQNGPTVMPGENFSSQRVSMDSQSQNDTSRSSMSPMSPEFAAEWEKLMALGGVEGLLKRLSLERANRASVMNPTPLESPRDSFQSLASPMTTGLYPSPPSSVAAGSVCSKASSVKGGSSPQLEATTPTTAYAYSSSLPMSPLPSPQQRQFNVRSSGRPTQNIRNSRSSSKPQEAEMDVVEKAWGQLFEPKGNATEKMGQVLRGIANYITGLSAQECVIVTPAMLVEFYFTHRLARERHPYRDVFRCEEEHKGDYESLCSLFDELECDYHLVKPNHKSRPMMPALTPAGFVRWAIIAIYAYPDEEARRLDGICKAGIDIYGLEGKNRLPTVLPRRLLPEKHDTRARELFDNAIRDVLASKSRKRVVVNQPSPPSPSRHPSHNLRRQNSTRGDPHMRASEPNIHRTRDKGPERNERGDDEDSGEKDRRRKSVSFGKGYEKGSSRTEIPRHNSEGRGRPYKSYLPPDTPASKPAAKEQPKSQDRSRRSSTSLGDMIREGINYTLTSSAKHAPSPHDEPGREKKDKRGRERDVDYHGHYSYGTGDFTPRQGPEAEVEKVSRRRRTRSHSRGVSIVDARKSTKNLEKCDDAQDDYPRDSPTMSRGASFSGTGYH